MSDMADRHAKAAQVLQNRLIRALADDQGITPELVRTWVEAVRVERESHEASLGYEVLPPSDDDLAEYSVEQLQDLWHRLGMERRRRHLVKRRPDDRTE